MKCPNKNTDSYRALKSEFKDDARTLSVISAWQNTTGSEDIPNLDEAIEFVKEKNAQYNLKQREFTDSIYGNLSRKGIITRFNNDYYIVQSDNTRSFNPNIRKYNKDRLYGYFRANNIPLDSIEIQPTEKAQRVKINSKVFSSVDILPESRSFNTNHSREVVLHLMRLFPNINVKMLSPGDAEKLYNEIPAIAKSKVPFNKIRSFYFENTAILISGRVTDDTAIEEILHPFVDGVYANNNTLFNNLLEEVKQTFPVLNQQIEDTYTDKRGFTQRHRDLEKVTQSLSRHFAKEYETNPTQSFLDKVKEFLEWFMDIIKDLNLYLTGKPLVVEAIKETAKMSDIAKLLNTSDIKFDLSFRADNKVRYNLSNNIQRSLNKAKVGSTEMQEKIIDNLFNTAQQSKDKVNELAASADKSIVTFDSNTGDYIDITDPSFVFKSTTEAILGAEAFAADLVLQKDYYRILQGAINDEDPGDIQKDLNKVDINNFVRMYSNIRAKVQELVDNKDSILLPEVVVFDKSAGIARKIDILRIDKNGVISPIDITSHLIIDNENDLKTEINLQRRLLVNMGYNISKENSQVMTKDGFIQIETSSQIDKVESIVPFNINRESKNQIDELLKDSDTRIISDKEMMEGATLTPEQIEVFKRVDEMSIIKNTLEDYKISLIKKLDAIKQIKSNIFMIKSKDDTTENLMTSINLIELTLQDEDPTELSSTFSQLLMDIISEMKGFRDYVTDPQNFNDPQFITYVLNFDRFMASFEAFNQLDDYKNLNLTQQRLLDRFRVLRKDLKGTDAFIDLTSTKEDKLKSRGLIEDALYNYVIDTYKNQSNETLTEKEAEELVTQVKDIDRLQLQAQDIDTSSDRLLGIVARIYKQNRFALKLKTDQLEENTLREAQVLQRLDPTGNPQNMYEYMIEKDLTVTKKIGEKYNEELKERRSKLFDPLGNPKEYRDVYNLKDASKEDIEYNKELARDRANVGEFFKAERVVDGQIVDGFFHKYTDEFKAIRDRYQKPLIYKSGYIKWEKKDDVSDLDYAVFLSKYTNVRVYNRAEKDYSGEFTGVILREQQINPVKPEFRVPLEIATDPTTGKEINMRSSKYEAMISDDTALGKARLNFYNYYTKQMNEFLDYLPEQERRKMMGSIPTIRRNWAGDLKGKDPLYVKLYAKMSRGFTRLFSTTEAQRTAVADEQGNPVDNLPIYFTGSLQTQEELDKIDAEIENLNQEKKNNKISQAQYVKKLKKLKQARFLVEEKPKSSEVNRDLATSLIMFGKMATHYDTMVAVEDTFRAIQQVIEKRDYLPPESTNLITKVKSAFGTKAKGRKQYRNTKDRMQKWMNMVFYNNEEVEKGFFDKVTEAVISGSALSYVAFNVFGNFNNYLLGRVMNGIEVMGQKYYSSAAYARATYEFDKGALPSMVQRTAAMSQRITANNPLYKNYKNMGYYDPNKPNNKYEAFVDYYDMMMNKKDLRESGTGFQSAQQSWFSRYVGAVGYAFQDAGEYNVQSKNGVAIVMDTILLNPDTGETLSEYDAATFDPITKGLKFKEGFTKVVVDKTTDPDGKINYETVDYDFKHRFNTRNTIREVNKQIHGNYAYEDRMVIQSHSLGKLVAQFHKWVMPAFRARYQLEYYDQNLGWMEGRYRSALQLSLHILKYMATNGFKYKDAILDFKIEAAKTDGDGNIILPGFAEKGTLEYRNQVNSYMSEGLSESQATARVNQDNQRIENKIQGYYRTLSESIIILTSFAILTILKSMFDDTDEDDPTIKRLKHFMMFQSDRMIDELIVFTPIIGIPSQRGFLKSIVASERYLVELYEALEVTLSTGLSYAPFIGQTEEERKEDKDITYQRGMRKGELKLYKEWQDALPLIGNIKKWRNFTQKQDFYIKD